MSKTCKHESSEAPTRGGLTRISGESVVMTPESRGQPVCVNGEQQQWKKPHEHVNPYVISKEEVFAAWQKVRAKGGAGGVDGVSIKSFSSNLESNLYKIWNRMSSGSYHPRAVKRVEIPKGEGKKRPLGIPTIMDRVAQEVVKARFETVVEKFFHRDSYGYRPDKSATKAVGTCRERCWKYDWVLDVDIQQFFDTIDHELMMKAVGKHSPEKWMTLYIKRWLKAPVQHADGRVEETLRGTPQGGVISPVLANLYLHYAFDHWIARNFPEAKFERYADDIVIHCATEEQTGQIEQALKARLKECGLTLHPEKTKVVYCKIGGTKGRYPTRKFTFLGYTFQPRSAENKKTKQKFTSFLPAVSIAAGKRFRAGVKASGVFSMTQLSLDELVQQLNPRISGWYNYFSHYYKSALNHMSDWLDRRIAKWLKKKFRLSWNQAYRYLQHLISKNPVRFSHWKFRFTGRAV